MRQGACAFDGMVITFTSNKQLPFSEGQSLGPPVAAVPAQMQGLLSYDKLNLMFASVYAGWSNTTFV